MRKVLFLLFAVNTLVGQDSTFLKLTQMFWDNQISIINDDGKIIDNNNAIYFINNQSVTWNCYGRFYRYSQLFQESPDESVTYHPNSKLKIISENKEIFQVYDLDEELGKYSNPFLRYKYIINNTGIQKSLDEKLFNGENEYWQIAEMVVNDSIMQYLDSCHLQYKIKIFSNGNFIQSYGEKKNCQDELNEKEILKVFMWPKRLFKKSYHSLIDKKGKWNIIDDKLYLRFENGVIYKYKYEVKKKQLVFSNGKQKIYLEKNTDL